MYVSSEKLKGTNSLENQHRTESMHLVPWRRPGNSPSKVYMVASCGVGHFRPRVDKLRCLSTRAQSEDPIIRSVQYEPIAFLGGVFAGLLKLQLDNDPLESYAFTSLP